MCVCLNILSSTRDLGGAGSWGPDRPFPRAGSSHPWDTKAAGEQLPPRTKRGEGERGLEPIGPASCSLLRARGPSQAAPPRKAPRDWGKPETPFPGHSGTALAAPGPSPYRSLLAAVSELQAAQLHLGNPWVKPEEASPKGRRLLRPRTPPQLLPCPLPTMIGCQVLAHAIGLAARLSWAHAHEVDPAGGNRWGRGQAEPESEVSWVCQDCAAHFFFSSPSSPSSPSPSSPPPPPPPHPPTPFSFFFFNFRALHFLMAEENHYFLTWKLCKIQFLVSLKLKQGLASSFGYCLWLKTSSIAKDHIRKA